MKNINRELIDFVKDFRMSVINGEEVDYYHQKMRELIDQGRKIREQINKEILEAQMEFNILIQRQQEYTQEVVPLTYHHYKDIKELSYLTLPQEKSILESSKDSLTLEEYASLIVENLEEVLIPELIKVKENIDKEIPLIEKIAANT